MSPVHSTLARSPETCGDVAQATTIGPQPSSVLVIEDDLLTSDLLYDALRSQGYEVVVMRHGRHALRYLRRHTPCLIVLDVRRPITDGAAFASAYTAEPPPHAPIIVVSAEEDVRRHFRVPAIAGYLDKPFDLDTLYALVGRYCSPALVAPPP